MKIKVSPSDGNVTLIAGTENYMGLKLGEVLLNEGLVTRKQLEEALKCQVIFGGRLGTNLVEMGIVDEAGPSSLLEQTVGNAVCHG